MIGRSWPLVRDTRNNTRQKRCVLAWICDGATLFSNKATLFIAKAPRQSVMASITTRRPVEDVRRRNGMLLGSERTRTPEQGTLRHRSDRKPAQEEDQATRGRQTDLRLPMRPTDGRSTVSGASRARDRRLAGEPCLTTPSLRTALTNLAPTRAAQPKGRAGSNSSVAGRGRTPVRPVPR